MMRTRRFVERFLAAGWCVVPLLAVVGAASPAVAGSPIADGNDLAERIDAFVQPYLEAGHLSGCLLVARYDEVLVERCWGLANHELDVPNTPGTRFAIASVTKPVTLMILARLVDEGAVALTDTLARWFGDFPRGSEITVLQLANHQAAVPHRLTEPAEECEPRTAADVVERVIDRGLIGEPGQERVYSSGGYSVLARVLELAGGAPYEELVQREVCVPAGMTHTLHPADRRPIPQRASSYRWFPDGLRLAQPKDLSFLVGAGSLYSTSRDLWKLMRAVARGDLGETAQQYVVRGRALVDWNGVTAGYRAFADYDVESGLFVAFTANVVTGAIDRLREAVPRLVAGESVSVEGPPAFEPLEVSAPKLTSYEGRYELRPGSILDVHARGDMLFSNDWLMVPVAEDRFFSVQDYAFVTFVHDGGAIVRMDWGEEEPYPIPRVGDRE